ncbi:MAG TPA: SRPBCC domain-containing protein [Roseiflexaceae bacterium]|nr:SRPBCC domain-containing protein [Roseiflexaceae bacterium]
MEKLTVERSVWIDASRERVWQAVTDPKQIQQWYSPTTAWELSALEVGRRLFVCDPETGAEMYAQ